MHADNFSPGVTMVPVKAPSEAAPVPLGQTVAACVALFLMGYGAVSLFRKVRGGLRALRIAQEVRVSARGGRADASAAAGVDLGGIHVNLGDNSDQQLRIDQAGGAGRSVPTGSRSYADHRGLPEFSDHALERGGFFDGGPTVHSIDTGRVVSPAVVHRNADGGSVPVGRGIHDDDGTGLDDDGNSWWDDLDPFDDDHDGHAGPGRIDAGPREPGSQLGGPVGRVFDRGPGRRVPHRSDASSEVDQ